MQLRTIRLVTQVSSQGWAVIVWGLSSGHSELTHGGRRILSYDPHDFRGVIDYSGKRGNYPFSQSRSFCSVMELPMAIRAYGNSVINRVRTTFRKWAYMMYLKVRKPV